MYRRKDDLLVSIAAVILLLFTTPSAMAAYFADYFPLTLGSWWKGVILVPYEADGGIVMQPSGSGEIRVFESLVYDGQNAFKYGNPSDYTIVSKSGNVVTVHAAYDDEYGLVYSRFTIGNIADGTVIHAGQETLLLREFNKTPINVWPDINFGDYGGLVESRLATPGLIFTAEFSTWSEPNELNVIVLTGLGPDIRSQITTGVSSITFWAPGIGRVMEIEMDESTGDLNEISVTTDYYIAPEANPSVLEGMVTDAITGLPLANAQLTLTPGSQILTTDSAGRFSSSSVPAGTYTVQVSAAHYHTKDVPGISLQAGGTQVMSVSLDPKAPLVAGSLVDALNDGLTPVLLTARVTHPEGAGFLASVAADLSGIGGSALQSLHDDGTNGDTVSGDGLYSYKTILPSNIPARAYTLTVKATDEMGFSGFGSILLNVIETVTGSVASSQSDTKTFFNDFAGQSLVISYTLGGVVYASSTKKIMNGCTVTLTVSGPKGENYGPYEVEDSIDITIPGASTGPWTYETESHCPSTVTYQIQTKGSGTGLLAGRVLDGLSRKGLKGAQVTCDTGGSSQSLDEGYYTMVVVAGTGATVSTSKSGYKTNFKTGVVITTGDTTPLTIQVVPETSPAQPVPQGQGVYQVLDPSEDPNPPTQPFAAAVAGHNLQFKALFPSYAQPVDLYLGMTINYPGFSGRLFLVKSDNAVVEYTGVLHAWRQRVTSAQAYDLPPIRAFTGGFPMAPYTLYALVTPDSSTLSAYELSYLNTNLAQTPPNSQNMIYVSNPSKDPDPLTQPLAASVSAGNLLLNVHLPMQEEPVTIFLAYLTAANELYLIKSDNSAEKVSNTLWSWRQNAQAEQREVITLPLSSFGGGNVIFYSMVTTDPGAFTKYNLIYFQKTLQ